MGRREEMSTETDRNHNGKTGSQRKEITTASKRGAELSQNTVWLNQKKKKLVATQKPSMVWEVDEEEIGAVARTHLRTSPQSSRGTCSAEDPSTGRLQAKSR